MMRKVVLHLAYHLLRLVNVLLDWLDRRPLIDEPITTGDPGARYMLGEPPPPVLRVLPGGRSNTDSDSDPRNDVPTDERPSRDHPSTPRGVRS